MRFTLRNIPPRLDKAVRARAKAEGKSLNKMVIELLEAALGVSGKPMIRRDLSDIVGTWDNDPAVEAALEDQRRIDPDMWK